MNNIRKFIILLLVSLSYSAEAYELATHSRMTQNAFNRILQEDAQLMDRLGLVLTQENLGVKYYDVSGADIYERSAKNFSLNKNRMPEGIKSLSLPGWLLRGAIREDDLGNIALFSNPKDDPYGDFFRVAHHFFDPINNAPLNGITLWDTGGVVHTSPAWALGTTNADALTSEDTAETGRRNHFTIKDAREYMYRALTGKDKNDSKAIVPDGSGGAREPDDAEEAEEVRKAYWATTFRALGDVVHLVQDAGQPQHTRNDSHRPFFDSREHRVYETYTNARALDHRFTCFNGNKQPVSKLIYDSYQLTPIFNRYGKFFSSSSSAQGLADYSNRGFFSAGTNVGSPKNIYASPSISLNVSTKLRTNPCLEVGSNAVLFSGDVTDNLTGSTETNVPLTYVGLWDLPNNGVSIPVESRYSLAEENYNAMADLLIPRAVAYSAGIINHFFRGRMEVEPPSEGVYGLIDHATQHTTASGGVDGKPMATSGPGAGKVYGFRKIRLKLRNSTPAISDSAGLEPQDMKNGKLLLVAKYRTNICYTPDLKGEPADLAGNTPGGCDFSAIFSQPEGISIAAEKVVDNAGTVDGIQINSSSTVQLSFDFSDDPIPVNAWDLYFQVVFRGELGTETDAVAVHTVDVYEPSFATRFNTSDYINVLGTFYTTDQVINDTSLHDQIATVPAGIGFQPNGGWVDPITMPSQEIYIEGSSLPAFTTPVLSPGSYFRVVLLTDNDVYTTDLFSGNRVNGWLPHTTKYDGLGNFIVTLVNYNRIRTTQIGPFRGVNGYGNWNIVHWYSSDSDIASVSNYSAVPNITNLNPLPVTNLNF